MSSKIKNGFKVIGETLVSLSEEVAASAKNSRRAAEEWKNEVIDMRMESVEQLCLTYALTNPDGTPLKGEIALLVYNMMQDALVNEDGEQFYKLKNELKEAGIVA